MFWKKLKDCYFHEKGDEIEIQYTPVLNEGKAIRHRELA